MSKLSSIMYNLPDERAELDVWFNLRLKNTSLLVAGPSADSFTPLSRLGRKSRREQHFDVQSTFRNCKVTALCIAH